MCSALSTQSASDVTKKVVDLAQIKELHGIKEANGGLEIGAMTPLTEVVKHPVVREKFSILMQAADHCPSAVST
jgi:CO/xanthine dehydrogenase FAD-binding subunit